MLKSGVILFTAFEPSGDALAAPVIEVLRAQHPQIDIQALGGPRMRASGAQLLRETTHNAVMLGGAVSKILEHRAQLAILRRWLSDHRVTTLVAVDSPAANWSICKLIRHLHPQARIVHLAAPQLWAWAPWRIGKLRRLTDHVLCLLPFEPSWFAARNVPASFIGHPIFDQLSAASRQGTGVEGHLRLLLLPGSRRSEMRANWPTMRRAFELLRQRHAHMTGVVVVADDQGAGLIRTLGTAEGLEIQCGRIDQVLPQAHLALVVSGTATLHVAAATRPMVVLFNVRPWLWHGVGRWMIQTRTFSLPNLIGQSLGLGRIVPEFVPHFGQVKPVADQLRRLIEDEDWYRRQRHMLGRIIEPYARLDYGRLATERILDKGVPPAPEEKK